MRGLRFAFAVMAAGLLAACGGNTLGDVGAGAGPAVPLQASTIPGLALSESGIGLVTRDTSYSTSAIRDALGGVRVETVNATNDDGRVVSQIAAFAPSGLQMVRFERGSNGIGAIHVVSDEVPGPRGARVGQTFRQTGGRSMECREGQRTWSGMAVCRLSGSSILFVYSVPLWTGGSMPRGADLDGALLNRMVWEP